MCAVDTDSADNVGEEETDVGCDDDDDVCCCGDGETRTPTPPASPSEKVIEVVVVLELLPS